MFRLNKSRSGVFGPTILLARVGCTPGVDVAATAKSAAAYAAAGKLKDAVLEYKSAIVAAPDRADLRVAIARVYLEAGSGLEAEKELKKAIERNQYEDDLPVLLAKAFLLSQKFEAVTKGEPLKAVEAVLAGRSLPPKILAQLSSAEGHAWWSLADYDVADKSFDEALAQDGDLAEALAGKGLVRLAKNDAASAREWFDKALAKDPKSAIAWRNIAALEKRAGNLGAAEQAFGHAIASHFNHADDLFGLMLVHLQMRKAEEASKDLERYKKLSSRKHLVAYGRGLLEFNNGKLSEANARFTEALAVAPEFVPALTYSGLTNYLLKNFEQAQAQLSRVNTLQPGSIEVMRALALSMLNLGDYNGAREFAEQVLDAAPDDVQSINVISLAAARSGDHEAGLEAFKRAAQADADAPGARRRLGVGLLSDGQFEQGFAELEKANQLAPDNGMTYGVMVFGHMQRGEFDKAKEAATRAQNELPENPLGWNLAGGIALAQKDLALAKKHFAKALEIAPADVSAAHNLASIALSEGDLKAARGYYEQALAQTPEHQRTVLKLAELDEAEGDRAAALQRLEKAVQARPQAPEAKFALARLHFKMGKFDEARKLLEPLVEAHPENTEVIAVLAELLMAQQQPDQALKLLDERIVKFPDVPILRFEAGVAHAALGAIPEAERAFAEVLRVGTKAEALQVDTIRYLIQLKSTKTASVAVDAFRKLHGDVVNTRLLEGMLRMAEGSLDDATKSLESIVSEQPQHREANLLLARAAAQRGQVAESAGRLEKWVEKYPGDTQAIFQLANVYSQSEDTQRAILRYQQVLKAEPNHALAHNNLAWLLKDSNPQDALVHAEAAARLLPGSAAVLDTLGVMLNAVGEDERAVATLTKASRLAPTNNEIKLHLSEAQMSVGDLAAAKQTLAAIVDSGDKSAIAETARKRLKD